MASAGARMLNKLEKYHTSCKSKQIYSNAVILDPRHKMQFFKDIANKTHEAKFIKSKFIEDLDVHGDQVAAVGFLHCFYLHFSAQLFC